MVAKEISPTTQRTFQLPNFEFKLADLPAWKVWFGIEPVVTSELRERVERGIAGE